MNKLTHLDDSGAARMVDVSAKDATDREAKAEATIVLSAEAFEAVDRAATAKKGDVLAAARIAGIMAAKKTSELIPLCHPLALTKVSVDFEPDAATQCAIRIVATVKTVGQTGVEMEALTAASIAALTIYDMIKAVDRAAIIDGVKLLSKSGGKSGDYRGGGIAAGAEAFVRRHARTARQTGHADGRSRAPRDAASADTERAARGVPHLHDGASPARHRMGETGGCAGGADLCLSHRQIARDSERAPPRRLARAARARVEDMFR